MIDKRPRPELEDIQDEIHNLSYVQLVLCGLVVCERLLPNYMIFCSHMNVGDARYLRLMLDCIWGEVGTAIDSSVTQERLRNTSELVPDSGDFPGPITGLAQFAVIALCHLLEAMMEDSVSNIAKVRMLALDSVDAYIQVTSNTSQGLAGREEFEAEWARIDSDPIMQAEIERQAKEIERISAFRIVDRDAVFRLKEEAESAHLFDVSALMPCPSM